MTAYPTCRGCVDERHDCHHRTVLRDHLHGLCVTSIKWKCKARTPRFPVGSLVWARTIPTTGKPEYDDEHENSPIMADFSGIVIKPKRTKMLVYIERGSADEGEEYIFDGGPFCLIPLSRLRERDGDPEKICPDCKRPASKGHALGYRCNPQKGDWWP